MLAGYAGCLHEGRYRENEQSVEINVRSAVTKHQRASRGRTGITVRICVHVSVWTD